MKSIFTYPDNLATNWIDPDYVGDATSGFEKRVQELIDGDYKAWLGSTPTATVDFVMSRMSAYNNVTRFEENTGNNSFYQFWLHPLVEFEFRRKAPAVESMEVVYDAINNTTKLKVTTQFAHGYTSGDRVYGDDFNTSRFNNQGNAMYVEVLSSTEFYLTYDSANTLYEIPWTNETRYNTNPIGPNSSRVIRRDFGATQGAILKLNSNTESQYWLENSQGLYLLSNFTEAHDTGTANQTGTRFYFKRIGNSYTWELFTDAAKTIPATLDENYITTATRKYTTAGEHNINQQFYADWGISSGDRALLEAQGDGWCRVTATVNNGNFTGSVDCTEEITTTKIYTREFWFFTDANTFAVFDQRSLEGTNQVADFLLSDAGSGIDVDITIEFINPARTTSGWKTDLDETAFDADATLRTDLNAPYEVKQALIALPGSGRFTYQDVNNVTQNGATYFQQWLRGDAPETPLASGESFPADNTITLDSNGRLTGFNFPLENSDDRGTFFGGEPRLFVINSRPSEYVPPATPPAELEDVFDTADYWTNNNSNANKIWPTTVRPRTVTWTIDQPSSATVSQSGVKYVRKSGRVKHKFEVEYPPMTYDEFQDYWSLVQAANGPATTFRFSLNYDGGYRVLFPLNPNTPSVVRLREDMEAGESIMFLEGFASNQTDVFKNGDVIITDAGQNNGYWATVIHDADSNIYGETKIRISHPANLKEFTGDQIFGNPSVIRVTLSVPETQYTVDTAGFYYLTVMFEADFYK